VTVVLSVAKMASSNVAIAKGRGFVYVCDNQLFRQVKNRGSMIYLKCCTDPCDDSAKIETALTIFSNDIHSHRVHQIFERRMHCFWARCVWLWTKRAVKKLP